MDHGSFQWSFVTFALMNRSYYNRTRRKLLLTFHGQKGIAVESVDSRDHFTTQVIYNDVIQGGKIVLFNAAASKSRFRESEHADHFAIRDCCTETFQRSLDTLAIQNTQEVNENAI